MPGRPCTVDSARPRVKSCSPEMLKLRDRKPHGHLTIEPRRVHCCKELEETVSGRSAELLAINDRLAEEINARKKVEAALLASEERYRRVFENTGNATILIESDMTISMANARAEKLVGIPREKFLGKTRCIDFVTPAHKERLQQYHERRRQGQQDVPGRFEFQMTDGNGRILDILANVQWIPESGQSVASLMDITRSNALQRERAQLATVIDQSAEAVIISGGLGQVEYVNQAFERLSGFSRDESIGQGMDAAFFSDEDRNIFRKMTSMMCGKDTWSGRVENNRKDGTVYIADTRIFPVCDERGKILNLVCVKTDVTDEIQLRKQLQHGQKMEALGTLAGGIAHDFNNILGGILGYTEISLLKSKGNPDLERSLGRIMDGCQRARELVQNILTFSRDKEEEMQPIEIQGIVKEALKLLRASIPSTVEFRQHICAEACMVNASPTQIHQVVMNLCTNASHAMEHGGGILDVGLENIAITRHNKNVPPQTIPGPYALLTVKDTGDGIDPGTRERIFEPYFTTKEQTGGTGLGLSVVHGIVKAWGGSIRVTSKKGVGTLFQIYLPRIENCTEADRPVDIERPTGRECVLVADDELFIIEIMADMLGSLGYAVQTASSGLEALQCFSQNPNRFDLVIADLTMPKITGKQLARKIKQLRKDIPIVLATGMAFDLQAEKDEYKEFAAVLKKPILYNELAKTLRQVLDGPGHEARPPVH